MVILGLIIEFLKKVLFKSVEYGTFPYMQYPCPDTVSVSLTWSLKGQIRPIKSRLRKTEPEPSSSSIRNGLKLISKAFNICFY